MPSKGKKNPKTGSRLSEQSASPRTPSFTPHPNSEPSEDDIRFCLQEASSRYPSLIDNSAIVGRISDVDSGSRGCKIWLSESSMVAASLAPGSVVSVSLTASKYRFSQRFPLSSISDECERQFRVDCTVGTANEVGNYFALASVFPSCKVSKNEVRLSANLSYMMGCPASGRIVFIYCVQTQLLTGLVNGARGLEKTIDNVLSCESKELYLELVPLKDQAKSVSGMTSTTNSSAVTTLGQSEGTLSSPKTPVSRLHIMSSSSSHLASLVCEETTSSSSDPSAKDVDTLNIEEVLKDESAKQLLQICAASWLYLCTLLPGNLVAIPILSKHCIFRVISPNRSMIGSTDQDLKEDGVQRLYSEDRELVGHLVDSFLVNQETKVYLCLSMDSTSETALKGSLPSREIKFGPVKTISHPKISKLGGLDKEYTLLMDIIISSMKNSLSSLGLRTTKGVLLHGPPGTGKTALAQLCAHDAGVKLFTVNGPEIISQYYGESEQAMSKVFESASQAAPAVVFIDDLDSIAPARKDGGEELSQRMVAILLNLMDGITRDDGLMVIAATNRPDSIEPALRRPGRLDREIEIGVPSPKQRLDILHTILSEMEHSLSEAHVQHLSMATHGFVGADLAALCNEAGLVCLRRYAKSKRSCNSMHSCRSAFACEVTSSSVVKGFGVLGETRDSLTNFGDSSSSNVSDLLTSTKILPSSCFGGTISDIPEVIDDKVSTTCDEALLVEEDNVLKVNFEDFENARMKVRPSAMREVILEVPKVSWEDVGGQREVKKQLMEAVEWPQKHQDAFSRIGTRPPTGVLMFGPPGCSKTLMARAVASEAGLNFLAVKGPELFSKWVGESEKAVRSLFAKARANAPSIIFFDEIDALAVIRGKESDGVSVSDRVMSQLLVELDGLHQRVNVTVIAATNRPDKIDPALLRPGRFDRLLYVGPPNEADREEIFHIYLRKIPCSSDVSIKELARLTGGCTGAVISWICREAAIVAIEESIDASVITMEHLKTAIRKARPTEVQAYEDLSSNFQRLVMSTQGLDQSDLQAGSQECSSQSNWLCIWNLLKSTIHFLLHLPAQCLRRALSL